MIKLTSLNLNTVNEKLMIIYCTESFLMGPHAIIQSEKAHALLIIVY